jgi:hypothetical protein
LSSGLNFKFLEVEFPRLLTELLIAVPFPANVYFPSS